MTARLEIGRRYFGRMMAKRRPNEDLNTHSAPHSPQLAGESRRTNTNRFFLSFRVGESPQLAGGFFNRRKTDSLPFLFGRFIFLYC